MSQHPEHWSQHFLLTADINMNLADPNTFTTALIAPDTSTDWNFQGTPFTGTLNGNGHIISNLTIDTLGANKDYLGLFGKIEGANAGVKDLNLENVNITGGDDSESIGGLCGENHFSSIISNCYTTGSVTGSSRLGALCGGNYQGNISNCYAAGLVTGGVSSEKLGGLCGSNEYGSISNCYASALVTGYKYLGGLCGYNFGGISNCYFLDTSGPDNGAGTPLTDSEMKQQSSFTGWDFVDETANGTSSCWIINAGEYPSLFFFDPTFIPCEFIGQGTVQDPYLICDPNDLGAIWEQPDQYYQLRNDLDLAGISWSMAVIPYFNGVFDGNGHTISNLNITGGGHLGLIGVTRSSASVNSLGLENVNITGGFASYYLGGLCGYNNDATISNCYSNASVTGDQYSGGLGGFCGWNDCGHIINCYANGSVTGGLNSVGLGGLCGQNDYGHIINCYANGSVTGGGASHHLGGLCGRNDHGIISNCYSSGLVTGDYDLGGLCGRNNTTGSISNCYFLDSAGPHNGYGEPLDDPNMMKQISFAGWDFAKIWWIDEGLDYPRLQDWQEPTYPGSGTIEDPYQISTAKQLNEAGKWPLDWDKYFRFSSNKENMERPAP